MYVIRVLGITFSRRAGDVMYFNAILSQWGFVINYFIPYKRESRDVPLPFLPHVPTNEPRD